MADEYCTLKTGVYCWHNKINDKVYVGSASVSLNRRKSGHLKGLQRGKSPHKYLQNAWNKYGEDSFEWVVLEICSPEQCVVVEQKWIDALCAANEDYGYNTYPTAGSPLGYKQTKESNDSRSVSMKRALLNPELRAERSENMKRIQSDIEFKAKRVVALRQTLAEPEVRLRRLEQLKKVREDAKSQAKKSASIKKSWEDPEVRRKRSEAIKKSWERRKEKRSCL